ncbi:MAG: imidazole glycerol phosphate synthase subunit HisH, partial [Candidatus Micrarchaeota archaeon]
MIAIINYGSGNIQSVKNALDYIGENSAITANPKEVMQADKIIFPGVGSFGFAMQRLEATGLESAILESIKAGKPFLGICLGLQLLFESSDESLDVKGLCVLKGKAKKFQKGKVPQIGWNEIVPAGKSIFQRGYAYFVNSYYVEPYEKS